MQKVKENKAFFIISAFLLVLFIVLSSLFPYTGDDWAWGSQIGIDRLNTWFDGYNGRYSGNLVILAISRLKWLRVIFEAVCLYLACYIPYRFAKTKNLCVFLISAAFLFLVPREIFTQAWAWASGFSNYVPPIIITLYYLISIENIFDDEKPKYNKLYPVVFLVLSFVGSLFMENLTLYNVAISALIIIFVFVKFKKLYLTHLSFFVGSFAGTIYMFSNSVYKNIAKNEDDYRSIGNETLTLKETIYEHAEELINYIVFQNVTLLILLSVLAIVTFCVVRKNIQNKKLKTIGIASLAINLFSVMIVFAKTSYKYWDFTVLLNLEEEKVAQVETLVFSIITVLYFISLLAISLITAKNKTTLLKTLLIAISAPIITVPLLVVNPIGPRCVFPVYLLICVFGVLNISNLINCVDFSKFANKAISTSAFAMVLAMGVFYLSIFATIGFYDNQNNAYIEKQKQQNVSTMVVCRMPYGAYVWCSNLDDELWQERYKMFHGIDQDVELDVKIYKDYNEWVEQYDQILLEEKV